MMRRLFVVFLAGFVLISGCKKKSESAKKPKVSKKTEKIERVKKVHKPAQKVEVHKKRTSRPKPKPPVTKKEQKRHVTAHTAKQVKRPARPKPKPRLVPDPRLLLTVADVDSLGIKKYSREVLPGRFPDEEYDSLFYKAPKGYGIAIQVWGFKRIADMRTKFEKLLADLPNAQKIPDIGGRTLFAYWDGIIYVGFEHPRKRVVVNLSCSRKFCSSDTLYEIARRVYKRLSVMVH